MKKTEILVIGAGVSGLTAASTLSKLGHEVLVVEARDRIGGRVLTHRDPVTQEPVEEGAEMVHGLAPELLSWIDPTRDLEERPGEVLKFANAKLEILTNYYDHIHTIIQQLNEPLAEDLSFQEWVHRSPPRGNPDALYATQEYIQGYHAADLGKISTQFLQVVEKEAVEYDAVQGAFFFRRGQTDFVDRLRDSFPGPLLLNHCVKEIQWTGTGAEIHFAPLSNQMPPKPIQAQKVVITLPIGVLQASPDERGGIRFSPPLPPSHLEPLSRMQMGNVIRATYVFPEDFLKAHCPEFLFILDPNPQALFQCWWRRGTRQITGWSGGPPEVLQLQKTEEERKKMGIQQLAQILQLPASDLENALEGYFHHDWNQDPFSRGPYPYVKVGGFLAEQKIAQPIRQTLFFAGDGTCSGAFFATMNGALKSGIRVAQEIHTRLSTQR